ncbi:MAG TPA: alpha-ketoglutarate-dependent dioxygenase AlkB [Aggregatilineales bacterium]|nr:alpha-ketoglutarate-dependent dioxygenase AlkB [Aggregatilineales bacterium]
MHQQWLSMPDADMTFYPAFFSTDESAALLTALQQGIAWKQEAIKLYGKEIALPRLTAWYGDPGATYSYSGLTVHPLPWTETLLTFKARIESVAGVTFNSVLLNRYRDGRDSVSWHADDEPELGPNPVIASVTFGAARAFQFKHKTLPETRQSVTLTDGSLLLMAGATQHHWLHQIPKVKTKLGERINLTFRMIRG